MRVVWFGGVLIYYCYVLLTVTCVLESQFHILYQLVHILLCILYLLPKLFISYLLSNSMLNEANASVESLRQCVLK